MRGKDILIVFCFIGSAFVWIDKYYKIPDEVHAQAEEIKESRSRIDAIHEDYLKLDSRLVGLETNQKNTTQSLENIQGWLKSISQRIH